METTKGEQEAGLESAQDGLPGEKRSQKQPRANSSLPRCFGSADPKGPDVIEIAGFV